MEPHDDKLSAKQIEDLLGITRMQLHYWGYVLGLEPLERSPRKGLAHAYSRENLFCLTLFQRLFQEFGFTPSSAVSLVNRLLRDVGLQRLQELPSVTVTSFGADTAELPQSTTRRRGRPARQRHRINTRRPAIQGALTIPLKDLQEVAHGPVN